MFPTESITRMLYIKEGATVALAVGRVREVDGFQCWMVADLLFITRYEQEARCLCGGWYGR